ncbi:hypothetical protein BTO06_05295 [Tenacibaculum sp. SZ-18]|uniref:hypothetical protein n=1 Tax=Tenacibaculum sp. SZ-18 TaxID=754423 RepID=UPI000C2D29B0|nr:hypothetical protein [Tenacibaculum sp. SZ-18]AUC14586.1 hypothetical protein BTO06_05295 [Tenacibaculum sp. SZ-18]
MKNTLVLLVSFLSLNIYSQVYPATPVSGFPSGTTSQIQSTLNPIEGIIAYSTDEKVLYFYNGTNWISTSGTNWLLGGNASTTNSNFLGTIDDVRMQIRSNNLPLLEFGRRQTLGLTQTYPDYTDNNQPLVHINGDGITAALQFAASGAQFYKPMFYTTLNGSFRLKGSSGGTDLFEIGSGGPSNDGRLEFIIGDDGAEPIIFKRYDFRNGQFHKELFRVQGSNNTADAKTRFGININTGEIPIDSDYDDSQSGFNIANSTLQVDGSVSKSLDIINSNTTLTEDHYAVVINGNYIITLPNANTCNGRQYILKNNTSNIISISSYLNLSNSNTSNIAANSTLNIQSDGSNWQQMNNNSTSGGGVGTGTITLVDKYNNTDSTITISDFNTNGTLIPLNSVRVFGGSVANTTSDQVQITESGLYEITYTVSIRKENGNDFNNGGSSSLEVVVCQNSNPIANTGSIVTLIGNTNQRYVSATRTVFLNLTAFQSYGIKIREKTINNSGEVVIDSNATGMTIKKIN